MSRQQLRPPKHDIVKVELHGTLETQHERITNGQATGPFAQSSSKNAVRKQDKTYKKHSTLTTPDKSKDHQFFAPRGEQT